MGALIASIFRQNGTLILVVVALIAALLLTNPGVLNSFSSVKLGPAEVTLRPIASSRSDAATVMQGRRLRSKGNLVVWTQADYMDRALLVEKMSRVSDLSALRAFKEFRDRVVVHVALLNRSLLDRQIDLFGGSSKARLLVSTLLFVTTPAEMLPKEPKETLAEKRRGKFLDGLALLKAILADASRSLSSGLAADDAMTEVDPITKDIAAAIADIKGYQDWLLAMPSDEAGAEIDGTIKSGYLVFLTYNLLDISYFSDGLSNEKAVAYFNLLYGEPPELVSFARLGDHPGYDFQSKLLVANKVLDESRSYDSPEDTFRFAADLYDFAYSFLFEHFDAPADRTEGYRLCEKVPSDTDKADVDKEKDLCLRLEYLTIPALMNNILFYPIQMRLEGRELSPYLVKQLSDYLEPVAKRAELLRTSWQYSGIYETGARNLYAGLMDTLATSRMILAAETSDKVDDVTCAQSKFEFAQVLDYLDLVRAARAAQPSPSLDVEGAVQTVWDQIHNVESRRHLVLQYCDHAD